jgi:hypothetical protein
MKRFLKSLILLGVIILIVIGGAIVWKLRALHQVIELVDTTELPQGAVNAPHDFGAGMKSRASLNLRMDLDKMAETIASVLPPKIPVPGQSGSVL